ncbi:MAG: hypothetical protein ABIG71_01530 [Candidatus Uhrbacteria bacterium]
MPNVIRSRLVTDQSIEEIERRRGLPHGEVAQFFTAHLVGLIGVAWIALSIALPITGSRYHMLFAAPYGLLVIGGFVSFSMRDPSFQALGYTEWWRLWLDNNIYGYTLILTLDQVGNLLHRIVRRVKPARTSWINTEDDELTPQEEFAFFIPLGPRGRATIRSGQWKKHEQLRRWCADLTNLYISPSPFPVGQGGRVGEQHKTRDLRIAVRITDPNKNRFVFRVEDALRAFRRWHKYEYSDLMDMLCVRGDASSRGPNEDGVRQHEQLLSRIASSAQEHHLNLFQCLIDISDRITSERALHTLVEGLQLQKVILASLITHNPRDHAEHATHELLTRLQQENDLDLERRTCIRRLLDGTLPTVHLVEIEPVEAATPTPNTEQPVAAKHNDEPWPSVPAKGLGDIGPFVW